MDGADRSKAGRGPGHKSDPTTDLKGQIAELKKRVEILEGSLGETNQWNNRVRRWIGKKVIIDTITVRVQGQLLGLDRYTLTLQVATDVGGYSESVIHEELIVHKGAIVTIRQG